MRKLLLSIISLLLLVLLVIYLVGNGSLLP